ncbi:hypothetical protein H9P43_002443 [Blastocladiella emersonii ATCC 22665]|nr:hypothetical protein H9P43_002443 [Blastocladiella emersonii ATCC 22665]
MDHITHQHHPVLQALTEAALRNDAGTVHQILKKHLGDAAVGGRSARAGAGASAGQGKRTGGRQPAASSSASSSSGSAAGAASSADLPLHVNRPMRVVGKTALHAACTLNKIDAVESFVAHPGVHVNVQDSESGWTALHRALYEGNLGVALLLLSRPDIDLSIRDNEGLTPFQLLATTMYPVRLDAPDEAFTWGHNSNFVLGYGAGSDSDQPHRVSFRPDDLPSFEYSPDFAPPTILQVAMAKMHSALLTTQGLYLWGYGSHGKLGFSRRSPESRANGAGGGSRSQGGHVIVQPQHVDFLPPIVQVTAVAVGRDHTVAVSDTGSVWVWGSNQFGQCGFSLDDADVDQLAGYPKSMADTPPRDDHIVTPRVLNAGALRREPVHGVAASKVHTCVWNRHTLITFGLNLGQLGHARDSVVVQPRKVASIPPNDGDGILQVACTERFTAVLLDSGELYLLQHFGTKRFVIVPPEPIASPYSSAGGWSKTRAATAPSISLITAGDSRGTSYGALITRHGDAFAWSVAGTLSPSPRGTSATAPAPSIQMKRVPPRLVWDNTKQGGRARDLAVGLDGRLLLTTETGAMYATSAATTWAEINPSTGRAKVYWQPFALDRVTHVAANGHGAFAALKANPRQALPDESRRNAASHDRRRAHSAPAGDGRAVASLASDTDSHELDPSLVPELSYFHTALSSDWNGGKSRAIQLTEFQASTVSAFVEWAATGEYSLTYAELVKLFKLADFIMADDLKLALSDILTRCLTTRNVLELLTLSDRHFAPALRLACARFALSNVEYLLRKHAAAATSPDFAFHHAFLLVEHLCQELQVERLPLARTRPLMRKFEPVAFYVPLPRPRRVRPLIDVLPSSDDEAESNQQQEQPSSSSSDRPSSAAVREPGSTTPSKPSSISTPASTVPSLPTPPPSSPLAEPPSPLPPRAPPIFVPVPTKKVSLLEIQAQEERRKQQRAAATKSAGSNGVAPPPRGPAVGPSRIPVPQQTQIAPMVAPAAIEPPTLASPVAIPIRAGKAPQKERKKQAKAGQAAVPATTPPSAIATPPWQGAWKAAAPPAAAPVDAAASAFAAPGWPAAAAAASPRSNGSPPSSKGKGKAKPTVASSGRGASSPAPDAFPSLVSSAELASRSSFLAIQEEQRTAKVSISSIKKKALAQILAEEAAVAALHAEFRQTRQLVSGEFLEVVVVPRDA